MSDEVLAQQFQQGDTKAFESLFHKYFKVLSIYAFKYVGDLDLAQDLTQEVFVKLYEKRKSLEIHASLKSFLYTAVRNCSLDHLRSQRIRSGHKEELKQAHKGRDIDDRDLMLQAELQEKIHEAVQQLPPKNQEIFKLSRFEGKKNQEIADQLGISKRTVETQISQALKKIRPILAKYLELCVVFILHFFS